METVSALPSSQKQDAGQYSEPVCRNLLKICGRAKQAGAAIQQQTVIR